jgi:TspO/MBR family
MDNNSNSTVSLKDNIAYTEVGAKNFSTIKNQNFVKYGFLVTTIITILFNMLSGLGVINGSTTKQVSDTFSTSLTPVGFTFSIWAVIYLGLMVIGFMQLLGKIELSKKGQFLYIGSCLVNCAWIITWHFYQPFISCVLLLVLTMLNAFVYLELKKSSKGAMRLFVTSIYLIYLGWTIVASIINITIVLKYNINLSFGLTPEIWAVIVLYIAMFLNFYLVLKELNPTTAIVLLWATFGIGYQQNDKLLIGGLGSLYTSLIFLSVQALREYYLDRKAKGKIGNIIQIID